MALVINTNISSLGAQRQLSGSGMTLDRATERLSSGLRVNSAKDDAAGLAIATRMTSQVRGLDQAVRNANDGVSLIQTAEGALQESTNILQRMRELAVQSSNGIYSDSDRKTLDAENKQLIAELDRIAKTTSFNGKNLLDGTLGKVDLQVGASQGQTISFDIKTMDSKNLGLGSTTSDLSGDDVQAYSKATIGVTSTAGATFATTDKLTITVGDKSETLTFAAGASGATAGGINGVVNSAENLAKMANLGVTFDATGGAGFTVNSGENFSVIESGSTSNFSTAIGKSFAAAVTSTDGSGVNTVAQGSIVINGQGLQAITNFYGTGATDTKLQDVINDINENVTGVTASGFNIVNASTAGTGLLTTSETLRITLGSADGGAAVNYDISDTADMDALVAKINDVSGGKIVAAKDDNGRLTLSNITGGDITVAYDNASPFAAAQSGASLNTVTGIVDSGSDGTQTFKGNIALKSEDGSAITITKGANGTDRDLAVLGFRETAGAGLVLGGTLNTTKQNLALANNDLKINGQDIGVVAANEGLAAKVAKINTFSDATGVTASVKTQESFTLAPTATTSQIVGTANTAIVTGGTIKINGVDVTFAANDTTQQQATKINAAKLTTGVEASVNKDGYLTLFSESSIIVKDNQSGSFVANNGLASALGTAATVAGENQAKYVGGLVPTLTAVTAGDVTINGVDIGALAANASVDTIITAINGATGSGVTATKGAVGSADAGKIILTSASGVGITWGSATPANLATFRTETGLTGAASTLAVNNYTVAEATQASGTIEINGQSVSFTNLQNTETTVNELNSKSALTGVTASIDDNGELKLESNQAVTVKAVGANAFEAATALGIKFTEDNTNSDGVKDSVVLNARIKLDSANDTPISVEVSANGASATGLLNQNTSLASTVTGSAISNLSIATKAGASAALKSIDTALDTINDTRSQLGSINNRLDFTVANLTSISEKTTAARSRIIDADFAQETANLSRSTVLQQAATAMLAQANQRPQNVLSLLR